MEWGEGVRDRERGWVEGDGTCAVLGRSHYRHHRATGFGWDGMRGERERG